MIYISRINYISSFHTKFYYIVYPMKAAFLILYIILFAFYLDNAFRITAYIFFFVMMLIVTVFRFEYVNGIWSLLCFMVPVLGLPELLQWSSSSSDIRHRITDTRHHTSDTCHHTSDTRHLSRTLVIIPRTLVTYLGHSSPISDKFVYNTGKVECAFDF